MTDPVIDPATGPGPDDATTVAALRAERDSLTARLLEAEAIAEQLADELAAARIELAESTARPARDAADTTLGLFATSSGGGAARAAQTRDAREALTQTLTVAAVGCAGLGLLLAAVDGLFSALPLLLLVGGGALGIAAYARREIPVEVTITDGFLTVTQGDQTRRLDLRNQSMRIAVTGRPGDPDWQVRFERGVLDPIEVDASVVDPEQFMTQLRQHRSDV
ncbi:hypothetical protein [Nocardioides sp. R-C-SC26]|uniref:hypothetical protein n=1 Tax=Nocardioides sp. R-C-SC26 TaxID=2870414 RepID=UPI001E333FD3|nr:hypothetical protein [Nocardioides sp. R-C-SC26]